MRCLVLLRGSPGCGKSSIINKLGWRYYTLEPDYIRLLFSSPVHNKYGNLGISQENDNIVWDYIFTILEHRMSNGEFTVIDATHSKTTDFKNYKKIADKYRYRVFCIDMSNVPIEVSLNNNKNRDVYKYVPESVIYNMYERFNLHKVPNWVKTIKVDYDENYYDKLVKEVEKEIMYKVHNFNSFDGILIIGDVHGCYEPLVELVEKFKNSNVCIIFVGDYIDRGPQNRETLEYLFELSKNNNVIFLEGNHEKWLWYWANDEIDKIKSKDFLKSTINELSDDIKKEVKNFYRKLNQIVYFEFNGNKFLVCHGGVANLKNNLLLQSTREFIKGTGKYEDTFETCENFVRNVPDVYQIFGHRNIEMLPIKVNSRCYNLEGKVEYGGHLRALFIDKSGIEPIEIKNNLISPNIEKFDINLSDKDYINYLLKNKNVKCKNLDNLTVFYRGRDTNFPIQSLFVNKNLEIVARGYKKFFYIGETRETGFNRLNNLLKFPVNVYLKENGFLGLVGYDENIGLIVASKTDVGNDYSKLFQGMFDEFVKDKNYIIEYIKNNKCTFVFEVIDPINDPHIIKYKDRKLVLLDIIKNTIKQEFVPYSELIEIGNKIGVEVKKLVKVIPDVASLVKFYKDTVSDFETQVEGYVLVDSAGYMLKIKGEYYNFWKEFRGILYMLRKDKNGFRNFGKLNTPEKNKFYNWLVLQPDEILNKSIIEIRDIYQSVNN